MVTMMHLQLIMAFVFLASCLADAPPPPIEVYLYQLKHDLEVFIGYFKKVGDRKDHTGYIDFGSMHTMTVREYRFPDLPFFRLFFGHELCVKIDGILTQVPFGTRDGPTPTPKTYEHGLVYCPKHREFYGENHGKLYQVYHNKAVTFDSKFIPVKTEPYVGIKYFFWEDIQKAVTEFYKDNKHYLTKSTLTRQYVVFPPNGDGSFVTFWVENEDQPISREENFVKVRGFAGGSDLARIKSSKVIKLDNAQVFETTLKYNVQTKSLTRKYGGEAPILARLDVIAHRNTTRTIWIAHPELPDFGRIYKHGHPIKEKELSIVPNIFKDHVIGSQIAGHKSETVRLFVLKRVHVMKLVHVEKRPSQGVTCYTVQFHNNNGLFRITSKKKEIGENKPYETTQITICTHTKATRITVYSQHQKLISLKTKNIYLMISSSDNLYLHDN